MDEFFVSNLSIFTPIISFARIHTPIISFAAALGLQDLYASLESNFPNLLRIQLI
jgi:hypothetical protein